VKNIISKEPQIIHESLVERWHSTEPGLRWAYIFSIVGNILLIRYLTHSYLTIENLLIPVTLCAWLRHGLRTRLVWIGLLLYATTTFLKHAYLNFIILGVVFNTIYVYIFISIALSLMLIALVRGFLSLNLRKAAESIFETASMRTFLILFCLFILFYLGDFYFTRNLLEAKHIYSSPVILSLVHPLVMIPVYLVLIVLTKTRNFIGAIFSPIILIFDTIHGIHAFVSRIRDIFNGAFYDEVGRLNLSLGLKIALTGKVFIGIILPILSILTILYLLINIPDTTFPRETKR
jgi:hypothetical protein